MDFEDLKERLVASSLIIGIIAVRIFAVAILIAIGVGIPAATVVWISEALKN